MSCRILVPGLLRILGAGAVLSLVCWLCHEYAFGSFTSWGFFSRFGGLAVGGILGGVVYAVSCLVLRVPELQVVTARFRRR